MRDAEIDLGRVTDENGRRVAGFAEFVLHGSEPGFIPSAIAPEHEIGRDPILLELREFVVNESGNCGAIINRKGRAFERAAEGCVDAVPSVLSYGLIARHGCAIS